MPSPLIAPFDFVYSRFPGFRRWFWRRWYQYLSGTYRADEVMLMNYGYAPASGDSSTDLVPQEELERLCLQLYDRVFRDALTELAPIASRDILEVGSGRGGGAAFLARHYAPKSYVGLDFSSNNVAVCNEHHRLPNLSFRVGDAEAMPFPDASFDGVVNVESSHCYGTIGRFFSEVRRVLREDGRFFYTDFRHSRDMPALESALREAGLAQVSKAIINEEVVRALEQDHARRQGLIAEKVPRFLRGAVGAFAGLEGSAVYESFRSGEREYFVYVLKRAE